MTGGGGDLYYVFKDDIVVMIYVYKYSQTLTRITQMLDYKRIRLIKYLAPLYIGIDIIFCYDCSWLKTHVTDLNPTSSTGRQVVASCVS